jgi:hypothetical protein
VTRGETRILDELTHEWHDRWVSVAKLATVLGYTCRFVERTASRLYWKPPKGVCLSRMYVRLRGGRSGRRLAEDGQWHYRVMDK